MREILFEYGFKSVNGIVKKVYALSEIPDIAKKCDIWNILPVVYVRQFTGLTDKNGTNIFEGDILLYKKHNGIIYDDFKAVVLFKDGSFGFEEDCAASFFESFGSFDELDADILAHIEVIGNIHKTITP